LQHAFACRVRGVENIVAGIAHATAEQQAVIGGAAKVI
jgi:hypothetical protein